ncbi:MAG: hypothetical protein LH609_13030 [Rudanella sp.]|nr:hypothetical protein [Rudanella sp.]
MLFRFLSRLAVSHRSFAWLPGLVATLFSLSQSAHATTVVDVPVQGDITARSGTG